MRATLNFTLPDESKAFDAALLGSEALMTLFVIAERLRDYVASPDEVLGAYGLAIEVLQSIPDHLLEAKG